MAGRSAILTLRILGDAKGAVDALGETESRSSKFSDGISKAAVPAAAALAGLTAAGVSAAKAAAEDQQSAALLAQTLRNSTGATDAQIASTEEFISKTSKAAAVADDELRPALGTLVRATGDTATSQDALQTALDVSAATGKDLGSVSDALAKAYAGNTASLGKLVPGMDKAVLATGDMDQIMGELARTTGGSAAAAAGTAAGQWTNFQIQMGEAQEAIGGALLPIMSELGTMLTSVAGWIQDNVRVVMILAGVIGGLAGAVLAVNAALKIYAATTKIIQAATKAWAAVQWLLNVAMAANPIVLIIIAVIALVAAFVILWNKSEAFRNFWINLWADIVRIATVVWDAIVAAGQAVWSFLVNVWNGILAAAKAAWNAIVNVVGAVVDGIVAYARFILSIYVAIWEAIVAAARWAWNGIVAVVSAVVARIVAVVQGIVDTIGAVWQSIVDTARGIWDRLLSIVKTVMGKILDPINTVREAFDKIVDVIRSVIDWLGRIKMPKVLSDIGSAIGGLFRSAPAAATTGALAAPGGVAAFGARTFAAPGFTAAGARSAPSFDAPAGGVVINVNGALDPVAVASQIRQILRNDERRRGGVRVGAVA